MIAKLPLIAVYSYHSYRHFRRDETLFIRNPQKGLSLAEKHPSDASTGWQIHRTGGEST